ncbi:MAG: DUF5914 domain-containing protein [Polyangiaceae bacterium]|nr:DUF5914 domain-containing protein [Polyangiaceae bacterium]
MVRQKKYWKVGKRLPPLEFKPQKPDWLEAEPGWISEALESVRSRPSGGWLVVAPSSAIGDKPQRYVIAGREVVVWRAGNGLNAAPDRCPHMGACLSEGPIREGKLVCPWHGLELSPRGHGDWQTFPTFDDGLLLWIRFGHDTTSEKPFLSTRPDSYLEAVVSTVASCQPQDVIANRLDPWHGVHFHPHSFATLHVLEKSQERLRLRVAYRLLGPLTMEVEATFHCPEPNTITMTIVDGEGVGSVVETHATPIDAERTSIVELTLATSERWQFQFARRMKWLTRPLMERAARRLWVEDVAYAERRFALRSGIEDERNSLRVLGNDYLDVSAE